METIGKAIPAILASVTIETDSRKLATAPSNAPRLSDTKLAELEAVANAPLPAPQPCDPDHFAKSMRALSLLPSRADDEVKGELRLAIYQRMLGNRTKEAISYLVERALVELNWFPSPKQCLDILATYRPPMSDDAARRSLAANLIEGEKRLRFDDAMTALATGQMDADALDRLPEQWKLIAVERGYLRFDGEHGYTIRRRAA